MSAKKPVTLSLDADIKERAEPLIEEMGLTLSTAVNAFLRNTLQNGKLPFEIKGDERAFWDKVNVGALAAIERAKSPGARWYNPDDVDARMDALFAEHERGTSA